MSQNDLLLSLQIILTFRRHVMNANALFPFCPETEILSLHLLPTTQLLKLISNIGVREC
jgi:hypothetical protein